MQKIDIRTINKTEKAVIKQVVNVHVQTFEGFFLTFMGKGFLKKMYGAYCMHEQSNLIVSFDENDNVLGFLAYSKDMSALYKFMIKRFLFSFAWYSLGAFLRKPKFFLRIIRAFLKPSETKREDKYINLSSIGVTPTAKRKGIGSKLINWLKEQEALSGCEYINLETDAKNNQATNLFYLKNGFCLQRVYCTKENRQMNEYRYYLGSK